MSETWWVLLIISFPSGALDIVISTQDIDTAILLGLEKKTVSLWSC